MFNGLTLKSRDLSESVDAKKCVWVSYSVLINLINFKAINISCKERAKEAKAWVKKIMTTIEQAGGYPSGLNNGVE